MNPSPPPLDLPSPLDLARAMTEFAAQGQASLRTFFDRQANPDLKSLDPLGVVPAFSAWFESLARDPARMIEAQLGAWTAYIQIWQSTAQRMLGLATEPVVPTPSDDRRFKAEDWDKNPFFDYIKQIYLATSRSYLQLVAGSDALDAKTARKIEFYTRQYLDALAPTNFALTNPQVLHATVESGGRNLLDGLKNFLADIDPKDGKLKTRMVDASAFELGRNVAVTPGKVVYQNDLMQLIQYAPTTGTVHRRPLLIIPPWINKYYILDLREKNSLIRYAVAQGHTVFVISWVNPDARLAHKTFDDYMLEGPVAALDAIETATGEHSANVIGYCLGGTLLACTLAYLAAKKDARVKSATFFTAMIDFREPGELGVFVDEDALKNIEKKMAERGGFLEGYEMANTFNLLRANDLIWSFVINNYLLGKDPSPFDLLYWNSDSTRMPAKMHTFYLRNMYIKNLLVQPGGIELAGESIDLRRVKTPACFISTVEDHIAPWKSTYLGAQALPGPVKFILGGSGHIAGIVNPPSANKYHYWTNDDLKGEADQWLAGARKQEGSWWPAWVEWIATHAGAKVAARVPGKGKLPALEDAPGSYASFRLDNQQTR